MWAISAPTSAPFVVAHSITREGGHAPYSRWLLGRCSGTVLALPLRDHSLWWLATRLPLWKISTVATVKRTSTRSWASW